MSCEGFYKVHFSVSGLFLQDDNIYVPELCLEVMRYSPNLIKTVPLFNIFFTADPQSLKMST